jgi:hypothetical protein
MFGLVGAEPFAEGEHLTLKVYCNQINCTGGQCNMTVSYPNSSVLVNQQPATFQTAFYFYNFTIPEISGSYDYNLFCSTTNSYSDNFEVTPNGELPTTAKAFFYIGLLAVLVFFVILIFWAHMQDQSYLSRFWWFAFMWIPFWAILFIGWSMARDFLTSQGAIEGVLWYSWLIIGVCYPFFLLGLVLYTFYYIYKQKEVQRLINRGFSLEEAQGRVSGRGRGMTQW